MTESPGGTPARRRRRRRASSRQGPPAAAAPAAKPAPPVQPAAADVPPPPPRPRRQPRDTGERGLQDLVGGGRSQLGVGGALRGRDVNRPTEEDLAEAERDVTIVRRHWKPTT